MGSRRLLWELHTGGNATAGLTLESIDQVMPSNPSETENSTNLFLYPV